MLRKKNKSEKQNKTKKKEENSHRFQEILQSCSDQNTMSLVEKQSHKSME